ncbi:MAG TPA: hypothetical protein VMH27_01865 [Puia sp.]|nr:hypothetical protein [Puia sp.]
MRNAVVQLVLVIIGITSIHAARLFATSTLHLRVGPPQAAKKVRAIQGHDTLELTGFNGVYSIRSINPGTWVVLVDAAPPFMGYRHELVAGPGGEVDLGTIQLMR